MTEIHVMGVIMMHYSGVDLCEGILEYNPGVFFWKWVVSATFQLLFIFLSGGSKVIYFVMNIHSPVANNLYSCIDLRYDILAKYCDISLTNKVIFD